MFVNEELQQYLETSSSINSKPLAIAEWNMNVAENISTIGNYRYRPTASPTSDDGVYSTIAGSFDINDANNQVKFYTGATDADIVIDGGLENDDSPIAFTQPNEKERLLYSLEDCFRRFRPRSGINKLRYFEDNYTHFVNTDLANRPRYYMASRKDSFKYWTSYRKENGIDRGIANHPAGALFYIDDAAPFIKYKSDIPTNKIVVKMQTNVGEVDLGPFVGGGLEFNDPFYGTVNQTTPTNWKIQVLKNNNWSDAISFNPLSTRSNGLAVISSDGYVEISYGLIIPDEYKGSIYFDGKYPFESLLPVSPAINSAYFVQENDNDLGSIYVWDGAEYQTFTPSYGWSLGEEAISEETNFVTNFINPEYFLDSSTGETKYKEFEYIGGIRVVVDTMNKFGSTFDLLELSPRLTTNITDRIVSFNFNKSASDLGMSGMPVGQLLASNGSMEIFDFDDSFNKNNSDSILSTFTSNNLQVKLFEIIYNLSDSIASYHVPLKTLYADGFPESSSNSRKITLPLRDLFFYFESLNAPQLLVESASLSYAVSFLLDSVGFSNYTFKRIDGEDDPIIPYFFVKPETSVAQVLQDLAVATQTAMFFDEYNNLTLMSKDYMMPTIGERDTDLELLGSLDQNKLGVVENNSVNQKLSNIVELSSKNQEVFNDGKITFQEKYIAKTYGSLKEASYVNQDQNWIYQPALLWEVAGTTPLRSIEGEQQSSSSYTLAAVPLNSDLSDVKPYVANSQIVNNVIDFGEGAYWVARYNGYFYANGEIIKYDAIEYSVSGIGNVWVSSLREYQNYFSKIQFGGKIYPTGRVRIYTEPFYEEISGITLMKSGSVRKHGREQFGTAIAYHNAGLPQYWSDTTTNAPVRGIHMDSEYLFSTFDDGIAKGVYNQSKIEMNVLIDIEEAGAITSAAYGDGQWVGVGDDGKFRVSVDGESWVVGTDIDFVDNFSFNSVAYGDGPSSTSRWIAVGYEIDGSSTTSAMAYSEDGESWTEIASGLGSIKLNKIIYENNKWVVVGNSGLIATSTDGDTWDIKTSRLDYTVFNDKQSKVLSATFQESGIQISTITQGTPGILTKKSHGLKENDRIRLTTSGSLPTGLDTSTDYYVIYRSNDTFALKLTSNGLAINTTSSGAGTHRYNKLAATFTVKRHGFSDNEQVRIVDVGSLPSGVSSSTKYAVRAVNKDSIHLLSLPDYIPIDFVSSQSPSSHKVERFVNTNLNSVAYGNANWVVVGNNGCISYSSDTDDWVAVDAGFKTGNIFDLDFGSNTWIISGASGKTARSTNLVSWSKLDTKLKNSIKAVRYANSQWIVAGDNGEMSRSTNITKWKTVKPKFGTSTINEINYANNWLAIGNKLQVSTSDDGITWTDTSQENVGELKFTTDIPHNFTPFDTISFVTTDNLPQDLSVDDQYFVTPKNISKYSFTIANSRINSRNAVTIQSSGAQAGTHKVSLDTVPDTLEIQSITQDGSGYVLVTLASSQNFYVGERVFFGVISDGGFIEKQISGGLTRYASFYVHTVISATEFLVSSTLSGTPVAHNDQDITLSDGESFCVILNLIDEILNTTLISPDNISLKAGNLLEISEGSGQLVSPTRVATTRPATEITKTINSITIASPAIISVTNHGLFDMDEITFSSTGTLPFGIDLNTKYYVQKINDNSFSLLSEDLEEIITSSEVVPDTATKEISSIDIVNKPNQIPINDHGLVKNDTVKLFTDGVLPTGLNTTTIYYVKIVDANNIYLSLKANGSVVTFTSAGTGNHTLALAYREQSGTHSFIKSFNDTNKIILNREVGETIPQYNVSQEEILVDQEDGETEIQYYYDNVSYKNILSIIEELEVTALDKAGYGQSNNSLAKSSSRNGIVKNYLTKSSFSETDINKFLSTQTGTIQSSALIFDGPSFEFESGDNAREAIDFISYAYKPLDNKFSHFGTRMRIIGKITQEENEQIIYNSLNYFLNPEYSLDEQFSIYGGSAGIGMMVNPETNVGYYFEIMALSQDDLSKYGDSSGLFNVVFYKIVRKVALESDEPVTDSTRAIPIKLWQGVTNITVDDGTMVGQFRMANESNPSVYDISVEYEDIDTNNRKFYLMINNKIIAVVNDSDPLPVYNNMALFVRGSTRAMFENIYAIANNYSQNTIFELDAPVNSVFGTDSLDVSQSFRKYALSGSVQSTYLSGIGTNDPSKYRIYFEEFGTIMRECSYFNVKYDKAYPALYAAMSETFNKMKGYTVSGFIPSAYGAEFLIFNNTDTALNLDETSGNYLRIQGVTFTQSTDKELTVDDYFDRVSNFSDPDITEDGLIVSPVRAKQDYLDIKNSRLTYGKKEFNISSSYIQSQDEANNLMAWMISKIMKPRKSVGIKIFAMPTIQLGDIVSIDYQSNDSIEQISSNDSRFVVYNIEYSRNSKGPSMNIFLSEVL